MEETVYVCKKCLNNDVLLDYLKQSEYIMGLRFRILSIFYKTIKRYENKQGLNNVCIQTENYVQKKSLEHILYRITKY